MHHTAEKVIKNNINVDCPYAKTAVCLKKGKTSHYHLVWNRMQINLSPGDITPKARQWLEKIEESVSGAPRIYIDNTYAIIQYDSEHFEESVKSRDSTNVTTGYSM